jgi:UDP-N-acetylmuramyl pentapeptide phosphotransferase/UDP-N-acetylglucosamine-1-phosphate transferase
LAVGAILFTTSAELRIVPAYPLWVERGLLLLAGLWFVNLVNFMDGLDWMTAAEVVPFTGAMVVLGLLGELSLSVTIVAAALGGAMIGFAPFNRPVAKDLSWRRRQSPDRAAARLVSSRTTLSPPPRGRTSVAALLFG